MDFEFVAAPGHLPQVVCWHAIKLATGEHSSGWYDRPDQGPGPPPFDFADPKSLLVCFVANAECLCLLHQQWPLPLSVLDLSPEFRSLTNGLHTPEGKGLIGMLRWYGLHAIETEHKKQMQKRIIQGWPFAAEERNHIQNYCRGDVEALVQVLPKILPSIDLGIALYRGEWVAVASAMEYRGVPINMEIFPRLANKRTWTRIRDAAVPEINREYDIYVQDRTGEWHFNVTKFLTYCAREGIIWPRSDKGNPILKGKMFDTMTRGHPQLEPLRQLKYMRDKLRRIKLAVGDDGRNRTLLWSFVAKTGRTQPKASQWIFSPAVFLRFLIKPEPGMALAYIDYSAMEFLIAAALSGDPVMLGMYRSGDPYSRFAERVGAIPHGMQRAPDAIRDRYKVGLLGVQYGMQARTLASRLGISEFEAQEMLNQHRAVFARYWAWSDDWLAHSLGTGVMRTAFDWQCRTGVLELNERSIRNWPIQATGAEILRIACIIMHRHGIRLLGPIHDAALIEAPIEQIESHVALAKEIMRRASNIVLGGNIELRTDAKITRYPDHFTDKRGATMWAKVCELLERQQEIAV
jgi:hypothetical protein